MTQQTEHPVPEAHTQYTKRDAETQMALGTFVSVIAIPVLIGTLWAKTGMQVGINIAAGGILLAIGVAMALWGWNAKRKVAK